MWFLWSWNKLFLRTNLEERKPEIWQKTKNMLKTVHEWHFLKIIDIKLHTLLQILYWYSRVWTTEVDNGDIGGQQKDQNSRIVIN